MSAPHVPSFVPSLAPTASPSASSLAGTAVPASRLTALLIAGCACAAVAAIAWTGAPTVERTADPELTRLLRAMALIKGTLLVVAVAALGWRFQRPVGTPFLAAYLGLAWSASAALGAMWQLAALGTAAVVLHGAGIALLILASRDADFLPRGERERGAGVMRGPARTE